MPRFVFAVTICISLWGGATAVSAATPAYVDPTTGGILFQALAVAFTFLSGIIYFFSSQIKRGVARLWRLWRERGE
ncbi:MAG: hypothetical protein IPL28_24015 [Chloroflexi bacterium]|nr:hypothetical protein [Chloroflexota bacterium]MDA0242642.1 hypothetical protein [Chloroflexota bacterium]